MKLEIIIIILICFILFYSILNSMGLVEGLDGKDEYYSLNKQKYKISDLNEIYEAKLKEFEKLKNEVDKHSKFMVKHLGKKLGIHKE